MALQPPLRIGILGFEGATALDIVGPAEAFASARLSRQGGPPLPAYEVILIGLTRRAFPTESGITLQPGRTIADAPALDTLIIPGGSGLRNPKVGLPAADWIGRRAPQTRRIASICTGIYGLAATGLLDGHTVTTHWRFAADVAARFPKLRVDADPVFLRAGKFYTSAGVTAGIDL